MKTLSRFLIYFYLLTGLIFLSTSLLYAEPLPLKRAVELALAHSTNMAGASADQQKALGAYRELKNSYVPQLTAGAGLGASWGFPLSLEGSAPSIFNVNAQSSVFNRSLQDFVRAARTDSQAAGLQAKEQRAQVIQDTVLTYVELTKWQGLFAHLQQNQQDSIKAEGLINERIQAGIDSPIDETKARLTAARAKLTIAQARGTMDALLSHLSALTGLPRTSIEMVPNSIPALPETKNDDDDAIQKAVQSNPAVLAADARSLAQSLRARGEHKGFWPTVDFAAQYAVLARYNNYDQFFKTFERNNATVGVLIRFPFFNPSLRARLQQVDADAFHAEKDAEATKNQVSEETLKIQRSVDQLAAAQEVADLEYQLADKNLQSVQVRMNNANVTIHDLEDARIQANERFNSLQDANFELERARVALLRATGELENWVGISH